MSDIKLEFKIIPPEGCEIDKENSTFECIKFKRIQPVIWRNRKGNCVNGFYINDYSTIIELEDIPYDETAYNVFTTEKQAKSSLAMARISQIMANDSMFGGVVTDEEWRDTNICKFIIHRCDNDIMLNCNYIIYNFLAFHTAEQRDLFLEENKDLVKDYLMID